MAQALFKSWFVDFEPVKAKMAVLEAGGSQEDATLAAMTAISGKDADALAVFEREHPEQYAELKATAELFPSAMQESELGDSGRMVIKPLDEIATYQEWVGATKI
jgi:type I restriction enzyme S subunit